MSTGSEDLENIWPRPRSLIGWSGSVQTSFYALYEFTVDVSQMKEGDEVTVPRDGKRVPGVVNRTEDGFLQVICADGETIEVILYILNVL